MPSFKIIKDAVEVSAFLQIIVYVTCTATAAVNAAIATTVIIIVSAYATFTTDAISTSATTASKKIMLNYMMSSNYNICLPLS